MIEILAPGPLATVQDLGRIGYAALGVPRSGAFDATALRLANRLVGNDSGTAGVEITFGGLRLRALDAVTIALTGAPCPGLDWGVPITLRAGAAVHLGVPPEGLRSYLAVRGGVLAEAVLGSRSTDTLSGLGPAPLRAGDRLEVGPPHGSVSSESGVPPRRRAVLELTMGPRDDWFSAAARRALVQTAWTVRTDSDRVGVRLDGHALERTRLGELPSEAVLPGAVQVPGDGRPIVFGPDAPVTGGYPVIAVVADPGQLAQLRPGDHVRFRVVPALR